MCVVLQVLGLLQVLGQVLGLVLQGLGRGRGRGLLRSSLFTHPQNFIFCQSRATPEPQNNYIINDTGTTPEGKKR
jgi:hypothetical protein